jgi:hypothetical protein
VIFVAKTWTHEELVALARALSVDPAAMEVLTTAVGRRLAANRRLLKEAGRVD